MTELGRVSLAHRRIKAAFRRLEFAGPATLLLAGSLISPLALGQANPHAPQNAASKSPVYEVVSIRPNKSGSTISSDHESGGTFSAENCTLLDFIFSAFSRTTPTSPGITMPNQIIGLPGWASSDRYNVEARADAETAAVMQGLPRQELSRLHEPMLRAMLVDRFKLAAHFEQREAPIYELVLAKGGPKLTQSSIDEHSAFTISSGRIEGRHYSVDSLAFSLAGQLGRMVVNKTGLTSSYDFTLTWTPDYKQGTAESGPTIFTALEEQLGLKLVSVRGPVDVLVIDHVERLTEN